MPEILLVDDDPVMIQVMGRILDGFGQLRFATSASGALAHIAKKAPDLVLLDAEMPGMTGYELCEHLKAMHADVPVIFVTAHDDVEHELQGLAAGAVDFIRKPISEPLLVARVRTQLRLKQLTDELRRIATTDGLTGIANRRVFDETLTREWKRELRARSSLSLLLVDIDHFKRYNDHYGHPAGDVCLRAVAQALDSACLRASDLCARYGGEEFALLLPDTPHDGALAVADRVFRSIAALALQHETSTTAPHVTVSIGVASYVSVSPSTVTTTCQDLVRTADRALYDAKRAGRARVASGILATKEAAPCDVQVAS